MTTQAETMPATAPPGAICRKCYYGLRGLPLNERCNECNTPVKAGLDPAWWANAPIALLDTFAARSRRATIAAVLMLAMAGLSFLVRDSFMATTTSMSAAAAALTVVWSALSLGNTLFAAHCLRAGIAVSGARAARSRSRSGCRWSLRPPLSTTASLDGSSTRRTSRSCSGARWW
ncbi:MAG: hypothetical protein QM783_06480 [Phycisphaerales bacterium]